METPLKNKMSYKKNKINNTVNTHSSIHPSVHYYQIIQDQVAEQYMHEIQFISVPINTFQLCLTDPKVLHIIPPADTGSGSGVFLDVHT